MSQVHCARCGNDREGLETVPFGGELGRRVHEAVCRECWTAWLGEQTIQMNEKRLSLVKPEHRDLLTEMMKSYLGLEPAGE